MDCHHIGMSNAIEIEPQYGSTIKKPIKEERIDDESGESKENRPPSEQPNHSTIVRREDRKEDDSERPLRIREYNAPSCKNSRTLQTLSKNAYHISNEAKMRQDLELSAWSLGVQDFIAYRRKHDEVISSIIIAMEGILLSLDNFSTSDEDQNERIDGIIKNDCELFRNDIVRLKLEMEIRDCQNKIGEDYSGMTRACQTSEQAATTRGLWNKIVKARAMLGETNHFSQVLLARKTLLRKLLKNEKQMVGKRKREPCEEQDEVKKIKKIKIKRKLQLAALQQG